MKYEKTKTLFALKTVKGWGKGPHIVKTFNAETSRTHRDLGWSQGITHFRDQQGRVAWCGIWTFEERAVELW